MTTQVQATSVTTSADVDAPVEHAFRVFTEGMNTWWNPDHHLIQNVTDMVFEPFAGGHIIDRARRRQRVPLVQGPHLRPAPTGGVHLGHQPAVAGRD